MIFIYFIVYSFYILVLIVTKDRSLSAQWEHTVLVTEDGYEILTLRQEEQGRGTRAEGRGKPA